MNRNEFIKSTALSMGSLSMIAMATSCAEEQTKDPPSTSKPISPIPLPENVAKLFGSKHHRLHHALWHGLRDYWHRKDQVSKKARKEIKDLGWEPPRPSAQWHYEKDQAVGWTPITNNGSGIDFLFMHREMIKEFDLAMQKEQASPISGWKLIPEPGQIGEFYNGFEVPPVWPLQDDLKWLERRFKALKSDEFYWSRLRWWDRKFHDHAYLNTLTLGQLGSILETSVHNDMHMRWAGQPFDPETGLELTTGRREWDISDKWDAISYDFLGETYSSQVNPVFWRIHKWVDGIIEEWYKAHEAINKNRVIRMEVEGIRWFEVGDWVEVDKPWSYPENGKHDLETMKKVHLILFPKQKKERFAEVVPTVSKPMTWF